MNHMEFVRRGPGEFPSSAAAAASSPSRVVPPTEPTGAMDKLVECVPNFSEGRDQEVIEAIAEAIRRTPGCRLLDVDPGESSHRTVYTFVAPPGAAVEGALNAARVAFQKIDMRRHRGEHPRLGALDVCPFVPVRGVTVSECVRCAEEFSERLAEELHVPVYLYGEAARKDNRKALPSIRAGEYEKLGDKLKDPAWAPDYGPATLVPSWGATVAGTRKFLVAFNINVLGTKEQAHRIALNLREQGRGPSQPGRLRCVQAIGWYLEEQDLAQVSTNILDHEVTPMHEVYEEVCKDAKELCVAAVGSQVVGLVPLQALLTTAAFYMKRDHLFVLEEENKIRLVVNRLGLDSISPFNPKERIIEYMTGALEGGPLCSLPLHRFIRSVGSRSPAPGGGSVAAAVASMGAALGSMVGLMTYGKRQFEEVDEVVRRATAPLHDAMGLLSLAVDADACAFNRYMAALKLPRGTEKERERRNEEVQAALAEAVAVPLSVAERVDGTWPFMLELAAHGNYACRSDVQVGVKALELGVEGAYYNVLINLPDIHSESFKTKVREKMERLLARARENSAHILDVVSSREPSSLK
ncbi:formimidoyltransferase-cyclodeaminase [Lethenteron reissneri]|uniref:formimidoyltransferase-cyclodeaminase n=1 Tax=Lethenteron reissneri TaxID=7753 RepID=UPI002AB6E071|nr:formimidoyltransferase-cyclodeaminase [Lethenteron reissneri]